MSLPGGPADKAGNSYEAEWFIAFLLELLEGGVDEVRLEQPGVDWAEGYTSYKGNKTWYQVKLRSTTVTGTIKSIESVLNKFSEGLVRGERCVYISAEGMQQLDGLVSRAREAKDAAEFMKSFLNAQEWKAAFEKLCTDIWDITAEEAYKYLKLIEVRTVDLQSLRKMNVRVASINLSKNPQAAVAALGDIMKQCVHKPISIETLEGLLRPYGIFRKQSSFVVRWRGEAKARVSELVQDVELLERFSTTTPQDNFDVALWRTVGEDGQRQRLEYGAVIGALHELGDSLDDGEYALCKIKCDDVLLKISHLQRIYTDRESVVSRRYKNAQESVDRVRAKELLRIGIHPWSAAYHLHNPKVEATVKLSQPGLDYKDARVERDWLRYEGELLDAIPSSVQEIQEIINRRRP